MVLNRYPGILLSLALLSAGFLSPLNAQSSNSDASPAGEVSDQKADTAEITEVNLEEIQIITKRRLNETPILLNLPTPIDLKKGNLEIHIQHRFYQSLEDSTPGDAFGIDSGANISLGIDYAITTGLSVGVSRARMDKIISFSATQEIYTKPESWWKMSLHGGIAGKRNFDEHYTPFLQLAASMDYKALRVHLVPTLLFNSRDESITQQPGPQAINPDENHTFSIGIGADVALHRRFSVVGEYVPRVAGFGGFSGERSQLGGGVALRTGGHVFTILVSRSRELSPTKYAVGSNLGGVSLGFNIYSRIR